ncbi:MAG TPA: hypothetical protein VIT43_07580 [Candidatus Dormibacteraeota bacterium]
MRGLSAILAPAARLTVGDGVGGLVLHVDAALVTITIAFAGLALLSSGWALGGQGPDVQTLAEQVNALQVRQALDQPTNPVMDGEPGLVGRRMAVPPAPAANGFFKAGREAAFSPAVGAAPIAFLRSRLCSRSLVFGWSGILFCQLWRL